MSVPYQELLRAAVTSHRNQYSTLPASLGCSDLSALQRYAWVQLVDYGEYCCASLFMVSDKHTADSESYLDASVGFARPGDAISVLKTLVAARCVHCITGQGLLVLPLTLHCYAGGEEKVAETDVAGIPDFWLHVLQSHKGWSEEVSSIIGCPCCHLTRKCCCLRLNAI